MPTYEFRCPDGHDFEKFYRSISGAESQAVCPVCGKPAERVLSAAGFAFKGSGFYLTDYGKNAHRGEAPPDAKTGESAKESGDTAKADSTKSESSSGGDAGKSESTKSDSVTSAPAKSGSGSTASEAKAEPKKSEPKPAPASPKPGASE